ncbi:DUF6895 family protein [Streptomyces sp. CA-253872]|uniref:DUF6895 family protein n=1 Tax=Streptomyces sp. CA-253872 TaxID=3240067 RepID=UPI003D93B2B2
MNPHPTPAHAPANTPAHTIPRVAGDAATTSSTGAIRVGTASTDTVAAHVLAGALRWIEACLGWFAPARWEEYLPARPFRAGPLLELLGLLRVLRRADLLPADAPLATGALDLAEEVVHGADFAGGLRRGDAYFPYHLNLIGLLAAHGRPQPDLHAFGTALLAADAGGHAQPCAPALNRLELRYFADRGGFAAPPYLPGLRALLARTCACRAPDPLHLGESETYALTHAVFYGTDFGAEPFLPDFGPEPFAPDAGAAFDLPDGGAGTRLRETIRVLLGVHLARGSLDLLAELLLCETVLGVAPGPYTAAAWQALAGALHADGAVPSPVHRPEVRARLSGTKATAYDVGTCYHTTTVAALAAAIHIERNRERGDDPGQGPHHSRTADPHAAAPLTAGPLTAAPRTALPRAAPVAVREWAEATVEALGANPPPPSGLRAAWADNLDPLLVIAVRDRDEETVSALLRTAARLGVSARPTARSARALLGAWTSCPPGEPP